MHDIFHVNFEKITLEPAIIWKLVTFQRITSKKLDLDGTTSEPAIRSSDTGQRIPCFDSCRLITTLMSNMCSLSVFLCFQTSYKVMRLNIDRDLVKQLTGQRTAFKKNTSRRWVDTWARDMVIWSGQWLSCFDSCQLTILWISYLQDVDLQDTPETPLPPF